MTQSELIQFSIACLAFGLKPGFGMFVFASKSISEGKRPATLMAIGTEMGHAAIFILIWLGISSASIFFEVFASIMAVIGGGVIAYIGLKSIIKKVKFNDEYSPKQDKTSIANFISGFGWAFINPINVAFYIGIFPTFIQVDGIEIRSLFAPLLILVLTMFLCHLVFIYFASGVTKMFSNHSTRNFVMLVGNLFFIAIGVYVVISKVIFIIGNYA